jgi:hypothetical protein
VLATQGLEATWFPKRWPLFQRTGAEVADPDPRASLIDYLRTHTYGNAHPEVWLNEGASPGEDRILGR